ncbi:hypothetical protein GCM10020369_27030 [Cryptosporangium minutisporangium]|uniref:Uncharacterized protein n=1 Tax=Cryptosporangium minutisporangium TaxID=113569 RepID=A0ABP6SW39_9ACTN
MKRHKASRTRAGSVGGGSWWRAAGRGSRVRAVSRRGERKRTAPRNEAPSRTDIPGYQACTYLDERGSRRIRLDAPRAAGRAWVPGAVPELRPSDVPIERSP